MLVLEQGDIESTDIEENDIKYVVNECFAHIFRIISWLIKLRLLWTLVLFPLTKDYILSIINIKIFPQNVDINRHFKWHPFSLEMQLHIFGCI